ncbi:hypothetical protein F7725_012410 [Dissostichus mawsoni]|uniref:Uncharacterized protein n=1 Tax=Dissostichus mawsoni TaxID=36200 RepID=A0A7J5YQS8_DISMA|nr:hypothetical protein F7725_012410 [Dissostichus mawsoni]
MLIIHTAMQIREMTLESCSPNSSSFCCSGVFSCSVAAISSRIFPISVFTPVATATPTAFPAAMKMEMFSPVRMDWSTLRVVDMMEQIRIFDPLHRLPVLTVNFPHLRLVLLQRLDGILSVTPPTEGEGPNLVSSGALSPRQTADTDTSVSPHTCQLFSL